jgi:hypothetical protein
LRAEARNLLGQRGPPGFVHSRGSGARNGRKGVGAPAVGVGWRRVVVPGAQGQVVMWPVSQLRREARLRREYLYRKAREEAQRSAHERKEKVRRALEGTAAGPACVCVGSYWIANVPSI